MQAILESCAVTGAPRRRVEPGTVLLVEGEYSGRLYVLVEGTIEVRRGETVVAIVADPGATFGEMSELLDRPHSATVTALTAATVYELQGAAHFLRSHPELAFCIARMLAQRLYAATTYLVDVKRQYSHREDHLGMIDAVLDSIMHHHAGDDVTPGSDRQRDAPG